MDNMAGDRQFTGDFGRAGDILPGQKGPEGPGTEIEPEINSLFGELDYV